MKIGLTGSIACGKSTVSAYLRFLGYPVVDADAISRAMTAQGGAALPALRAAFGDDIFFPDGTLDRRALGSLVFGSPEKRTLLNGILHPMIIKEIERQLAAHNTPDSLVFGDVPLLFECRMERCFDRIWVVYAERETQIARLFARDGLTREEAEQRIDAQMPQAEKLRLADDAICSEGTIEQTREQVMRLLASIPQRRHV